MNLGAEADADALAEPELRPPQRPPAAAPHPALLRQMTRAFLAIAALCCAAGSVLFLADGGAAEPRTPLVAMYALLALAAAFATRLPQGWITHALTGCWAR